MKIGVIGATGKAGRLIMEEARNRNHEVTAIIRNKARLGNPLIPVLEKDIFDLTKEDLQSFDVVVNAYGAPFDHSAEKLHPKAGRVLISALSGTKVRLIVVGGAGSLYLDETHTKKVADILPEVVLPTAKGQAKNLEDLRQTVDLDWTFVSPAMMFAPQGRRTGKYQLGTDHVILNSQGESYISYADYAIAIVDEIESARHVRCRITVASER